MAAPSCVNLSPSMGCLLEKDSNGLFKDCWVTRGIHHARGLYIHALFPFCKILPRLKKLAETKCHFGEIISGD